MILANSIPYQADNPPGAACSEASATSTPEAESEQDAPTTPKPAKVRAAKVRAAEPKTPTPATVLTRPKPKPMRAPVKDSTPPPQRLITAAFPAAKLPPAESASSVDIPELLKEGEEGALDADEPVLDDHVPLLDDDDSEVEEGDQDFEKLVPHSEVVVVKVVSQLKSTPAVAEPSFPVKVPTWGASQAAPDWPARLASLKSVKRSANNPVLLQNMATAGLVIPTRHKGVFSTRAHYHAYLDGAITIAAREVAISEDNSLPIGQDPRSHKLSHIRSTAASPALSVDERPPSRASTSSHASNKRGHSPDPGRP